MSGVRNGVRLRRRDGPGALRSALALGGVLALGAGCGDEPERRRLAELGPFAGEAEAVVVSERPRRVADLYAARGDRPLLLLAHGSDPAGRRSEVARVLGRRFQADGFPVLALDLRGFGQSEDPSLPLGDEFGFEEDLVAAARWARDHATLATEGVVYVGYSLGAGVALRAARLEPPPAGVVAIGSPHTRESFTLGGETWRRPFAERRFRDMQLAPDERSVTVLADYLLAIDVVKQLERADLPPVLLVYGELDRMTGAPGPAALPRVVDLVRRRLPSRPGGPTLQEIPGVGHDLGIRAGPAGAARYDQRALDALAATVEGWVLREAG